MVVSVIWGHKPVTRRAGYGGHPQGLAGGTGRWEPDHESRGLSGCPQRLVTRTCHRRQVRGIDGFPSSPCWSGGMGTGHKGLRWGTRRGLKRIHWGRVGLSQGVPALAEKTGTGPLNPESGSRWSAREDPREKGGSAQTLTHRPPPERVGVGGEVGVGVLLGQIDQEGGEDEHQEPDVPGGDQLLRAATGETTGRAEAEGREEAGMLRPPGRGGEVGASQNSLWACSRRG